LERTYSGKKILITGGLGFIGSNLAIKLARSGAEATVVDVLWPEHGGNYFNVEPVKKDIQINICDVRDEYAMNTLVKGMDCVFHLAGQCSHVLGQVDPYPDIDINIHGTAILMEAVKKHAPNAVTIYTSTRGVYGSATTLPVNEDAPTNPKGLYELSNLTAEKIVKFYGDIHGLKVVNLRLSNIYGERSQMQHAKFGVVNWFIRQALDGETIQVFGGGNIMRDFLYIDDCVEAIILAGFSEKAHGGTFNVGNSTHTTILELVDTIFEVVKNGKKEDAPFSEERAAQEPGDFYPDISRIQKVTGWRPKTGLKEGLTQTVAYYKKYKEMYW
jgi:UDP-glucose 4-epimerase